MGSRLAPRAAPTAMLTLALAGGVALGHLAGGRISGLRRLRLHGLPLLAAALGIQLALGSVAGSWRWLCIDVSYALVGVWLVANLRDRAPALRLGLALVATGWLCNLVPVVANGGMPVSIAAARRVGSPVATAAGHGGRLSKHLVADADTAFRWLGDVIEVPVFRGVISVGDIVLTAGIVLTIAAAMRRRDDAAASTPEPARA